MTGTTKDAGFVAGVIATVVAFFRYLQGKNRKGWVHAKIVDPECERKVAELELAAVAQASETMSLKVEKAKLEMKVQYMQIAIDEGRKDRDELRATVAILSAKYEELRREIHHD